MKEDAVSTPAPTLPDVLAAITRGRVPRLDLTPEQRHAFRDRDGRIALDVLRHLLGARASLDPEAPLRFPLTEHVFQTVARLRGHHVGIKRIRAMLRRLRVVHVIEDAGSYRQAYRNTGGSNGYRVALYRLGDRVRGAVVRGVLRVAASPKPPVGRKGPVKKKNRVRWWSHPLFGDLSGLPPPGLSTRAAARMVAMDEREWTWR